MSSRTKVTEAVYGQVKLLQQNGVGPSVLKKITGLGSATIARIRVSENLNEYREVTKQRGKELRAKYRYERDGKNNTGTAVDTDTTKLEELKVLRNLTDALVKMSESFDSMSEKLDEVLETKRPWINRLKS